MTVRLARVAALPLRVATAPRARPQAHSPHMLGACVAVATVLVAHTMVSCAVALAVHPTPPTPPERAPTQQGTGAEAPIAPAPAGKHVLLVSLPFRGHSVPLVRLARSLLRRGHDVTFVTHGAGPGDLHFAPTQDAQDAADGPERPAGAAPASGGGGSGSSGSGNGGGGGGNETVQADGHIEVQVDASDAAAALVATANNGDAVAGVGALGAAPSLWRWISAADGDSGGDVIDIGGSASSSGGPPGSHRADAGPDDSQLRHLREDARAAHRRLVCVSAGAYPVSQRDLRTRLRAITRDTSTFRGLLSLLGDVYAPAHESLQTCVADFVRGAVAARRERMCRLCQEQAGHLGPGTATPRQVQATLARVALQHGLPAFDATADCPRLCLGPRSPQAGDRFHSHRVPEMDACAGGDPFPGHADGDADDGGCGDGVVSVAEGDGGGDGGVVGSTAALEAGATEGAGGGSASGGGAAVSLEEAPAAGDPPGGAGAEGRADTASNTGERRATALPPCDARLYTDAHSRSDSSGSDADDGVGGVPLSAPGVPDLIVVDAGVLGPGLEVAQAWGIPVVVVSPTLLFSGQDSAAYTPSWGTGFSAATATATAADLTATVDTQDSATHDGGGGDRGGGSGAGMSLTERCMNLLFPRLLSVALTPPFMQLNKRRWEGGLPAFASHHDVLLDTPVIATTAFGLEYPRPVPPQTVLVGPIMPPAMDTDPAGIAPPLRAWLDGVGPGMAGDSGAGHGEGEAEDEGVAVVYVRLGAMTFPDDATMAAIAAGMRAVAAGTAVDAVADTEAQSGAHCADADAATCGGDDDVAVPAAVPHVGVHPSVRTRVRVLWAVPASQRESVRALALPPNVRVLPAEATPHFRVLAHPRVRAVVSHCGLLAAQEALYFGVPVACVPFFGDQLDVAARVVDAGAGVAVARVSGRVTAQAVASAVAALVGSGPTAVAAAAGAARLARVLRLAGGVDAATDVVETALRLPVSAPFATQRGTQASEAAAHAGTCDGDSTADSTTASTTDAGTGAAAGAAAQNDTSAACGTAVGCTSGSAGRRTCMAVRESGAHTPVPAPVPLPLGHLRAVDTVASWHQTAMLDVLLVYASAFGVLSIVLRWTVALARAAARAILGMGTGTGSDGSGGSGGAGGAGGGTVRKGSDGTLAADARSGAAPPT